MLHKLIYKFQAKSLYHLVIIFIIFAISGSLSLLFSEPVLNFLNLKVYFTYYPFYFILRIIILIPIYQATLIIVGTLFGQFDYFWEFEKKLLKKLKIVK